MIEPTWTKRLSFAVKGKPKALGRARAFIRHGRIAHFTPDDSKEWMATVHLTAIEFWRGSQIQNPCRLQVEFFLSVPTSKSGQRQWMRQRGLTAIPTTYPHTTKPDLDNQIKAIKDALTKAEIWRDDCLVSELIAKKAFCQPGHERAEITVWEME